jgi:hypothetical protein
MTLEEFNQLPYGAIFGTGVLPNSPDGIFMTNGGGNLRWVAKKGGGDDWAIYCFWSLWAVEQICESGDKITNELNILKCLPDAQEILPLYRK